jgi:hypothetical protein
MFTGLDVIKKAICLIEPAPLSYYTCSPWCPWCAIAMAKDILDDKYDTGPNMSDVFRQVFVGGIRNLPGDEPLIAARTALEAFEEANNIQISQKEALRILQEAKVSLEKIGLVK